MTESDDPVEMAQSVLVDYLDALENGTEPSLETYEARLDDEAARTEFRELLEATRWARALFPVTTRAETVIAARYRLLRELGAGGFGKVWLAADQQLDDRKVAIKIINALAISGDVRTILDREREALSRVHHPGIVAIRDVGSHDGSPFLVMDLVEGVPLDRLMLRLRAGPVPPPLTRLRDALPPCPPGRQELVADDYWRSMTRIFIEVLRALEAAHAQGIVHRDIKPANVMLTGGGHPVLLDFGIAGIVDRHAGTVTGRLLGTLNYLAPEQLAEHRIGSSPATDIYQVGLLLYEATTLETAFPLGQDLAATMQGIRTGGFRSPRLVQRRLPRSLEDICLKALELDPARRYANAAEFRADLEAFLRGAPPLHGGKGVIDRTWRRVRRGYARHRPLVWTCAAGLAGVLLTLAAWAGTNFGFEVPGGVNWQQGAFDLQFEARREGEAFGMLWVTDEAGGVRGIVPLVVEAGSNEGGQPVEAGSNPLRYFLPESVSPGDLDPERLLPLFRLSSAAEATELRTAWQTYLDWMGQNGAPWVPVEEARGFAEALSQASRGAGSVGEMDTEALLGEGWYGSEIRK